MSQAHRTKWRLRFGAILLPYGASFSQISRAASRAEKLGFDSIWVSDHLQRKGIPTLECWSTICALAATTTRIRIGSLVTCNSFRHPSLLARIISTASNISNGRIDVGIGLGYDRTEHLANGFPFPSFNERAGRLSESLTILNRLLTYRGTNFNGRYFKLNGALSSPRPKGTIRIWLAGRNKKVMKIASKEAYGLNILPYPGTADRRRISSFEELEKISEEIDLLARKRERFGKSMYCGDGGLVIGMNKDDYEARLKRCAREEGVSVTKFKKNLENLSAVHGTVEECRTSVSRLASMGFEELMFIFPGWRSEDYANMDLFSEEFIRS